MANGLTIVVFLGEKGDLTFGLLHRETTVKYVTGNSRMKVLEAM